MLEDGLISKKLAFFSFFFLRFSTSDFKFNGHIAERYDIVRSDDLKDKIILVKTSHGGRLSGFVENLSMFVPAGRGSLV